MTFNFIPQRAASKSAAARPGRNRRRWMADCATTVATAVLYAAALLGTAAGQDDDGLIEGEDPPPVAVNQFELQPEWFDQNVFGVNRVIVNGRPQTQNGQERVHKQLAMRMQEIDRICQLTPDQKRKLKLAASGDLKRFFDKVEVVRAKFMEVRKDQNRFGNLWQEMHELQMEVNSGLFGSGSLFTKVVRRTLTSEQLAKFDAVENERRLFRYEANVGIAIAELEQRLPLRDEQRQKLTALILEASQPPAVSGRYNNQVVWYFASEIPEDRLKPLFDDVQWKILQNQLAQGKAMKQMLQRNKYID